MKYKKGDSFKATVVENNVINGSQFYGLQLDGGDYIGTYSETELDKMSPIIKNNGDTASNVTHIYQQLYQKVLCCILAMDRKEFETAFGDDITVVELLSKFSIDIITGKYFDYYNIKKNLDKIPQLKSGDIVTFHNGDSVIYIKNLSLKVSDNCDVPKVKAHKLLFCDGERYVTDADFRKRVKRIQIL